MLQKYAFYVFLEFYVNISTDTQYNVLMSHFAIFRESLAEINVCIDTTRFSNLLFYSDLV